MPKKFEDRPSNKEVFEFLYEGLEKEHPIAFLNLDNEYLIRDIHKEDQRVLNDFKNNYKNNIDIDENTYMICPRNKEEVLGLIKVNGCVELLCADDKFKLNNKMMEVLEKRYQ